MHVRRVRATDCGRLSRRVVHIPLRDLKAAGRLLMRVNLINDQGSRARFWLDKVRLVQ